MTRNTHQPLSRVMYRKACLRAWGYAVVSIPWHDWILLGGAEQLPDSQKAKDEYLRALLEPLLPNDMGEEGENLELSTEVFVSSGAED